MNTFEEELKELMKKHNVVIESEGIYAGEDESFVGEEYYFWGQGDEDIYLFLKDLED